MTKFLFDEEQGWIEVRSSDELEALLVKTQGFHDALIKEIVIFSEAYVQEDRSAYENSFVYNGSIVIQSQWREYPVVEIVLFEIESFCFKLPYWMRSDAEYKDEKIFFYPWGKRAVDQEEAIVARHMFYRIRTEGGLGDVRTYTKQPEIWKDEDM